jgi:hypothetical protein
MIATRREFLGNIAGGAALFGALPLSSPHGPVEFARATAPAQNQPWDLSWTKRVNGRHKAVFDVPEIESGYGVWRASVWMNQYSETLGADEKDLRTILILRHNGIALAMSQPFWDEYGVGKAKKATHPLTQQPTDRNPALLAETDGVPAPFSTFALPRFVSRGGIVLACNLAFDECVGLVKARHSLDDTAARTRALSGLIPGVILQPSGVFAAVRAQESGAVYVRAS